MFRTTAKSLARLLTWDFASADGAGQSVSLSCQQAGLWTQMSQLLMDRFSREIYFRRLQPPPDALVLAEPLEQENARWA
jgi:hypothetical protein